MDYVFRGDSRSKKDLEKTNPKGFLTWVPDLTIEDRRDLVLLWCNLKQLNACSERMQKLVKKGQLTMDPSIVQNKPRQPLDLMRVIIAKKDRNRPTISTDPQEDCGGYANGYIHKIATGHLKKVDWKAAVSQTLRPAQMWPHLYLDTNTLETANHIAIHATIGSTREFTFFTHIPLEKISELRKA